MIELSLGQRLRELRDKADLSLRELAKRIGVTSPFLSDIELGRRFPSEQILAKLAGALNVSLEDLKQYDNRGPIADLKGPLPFQLYFEDLGEIDEICLESLKNQSLLPSEPAPIRIERFVEKQRNNSILRSDTKILARITWAARLTQSVEKLTS
jgi:transcriptional regulator with XRE-family HTH domain